MGLVLKCTPLLILLLPVCYDGVKSERVVCEI